MPNHNNTYKKTLKRRVEWLTKQLEDDVLVNKITEKHRSRINGEVNALRFALDQIDKNNTEKAYHKGFYEGLQKTPNILLFEKGLKELLGEKLYEGRKTDFTAENIIDLLRNEQRTTPNERPR